MQELIHRCPSVLPIPSIEPAFWPAASVCTELPLRSGFLDNLLVTPLGDIIAVECKLWRNGEARREVVAQIIDYAKDLQALSYTELQEAIRTARKEPKYSLFADASAAAQEPEPPLNEDHFIDAVSRNLRRSRCLLVIVGDGITENVEAMSEFLQQHAGLHFALVLVQLAIHELPGTSQRLVVPSIPMRTINIVRGIVQIEDGRPNILPPREQIAVRRASTLSEDEFFASLDEIRPRTSESLLSFLKNCEGLQISWEVKKTLIIRMIVDEFKIIPFVVYANGNVDTGYTSGRKNLLHGFLEALSIAIPDAVIKETPKTSYVKKTDGSFFTVGNLLDNTAGARVALERLNRDLRKAAGDE